MMLVFELKSEMPFEGRPFAVSFVELPDLAFMHAQLLLQCPQVAAVLELLDNDTTAWPTMKYLCNEVAFYGPSSDGYTRREESNYTAAQKL